ncbi:alpha/beta hydrolase [Trichocoleus sp. FACHB-591]|uniref:alpha/beta fold hydrolase n=1 Tax=Trichocoleus sp. FACHB-591 TaxID=2692872 RepID=UPI001684ACBA|nr:alpha/beta hydrolase [Trichocoleus sp. FACHB-591]MBD2094322.1 alpha/beta hydrolase [Trichocoleus sp. FACHB-591]
MIFTPLEFLLRWLAGLFSIALLGGGIYILHEWYEGDLISDKWLIAGSLMTLWAFVGFLPLLLFRRPGKDEPKAIRSQEVRKIPRPDGSEIHVEFYGPVDAQPIIFTHGWGPNSTVWYYAKKQLGDRFRLILWDLPGLGKSKKPQNEDYSIEKYASDLEAVLAMVGDKPAILLGHSMGGMIILTFCRLFSERLRDRVAGLVLVDTTYTNPLKTAILSRLLQALQKPLIEPLLHLTIWLSPLFWLISGLSYLNGSMHLTTEISGFTGRETRGQLNFSTILGLIAQPGILARGVLAMLRYDERATLPTVAVPTLVIAGHADIATVPAAHEYMSSHLPNAELKFLRPAGHMGLMERNEQFSAAVSSFTTACSCFKGLA